MRPAILSVAGCGICGAISQWPILRRVTALRLLLCRRLVFLIASWFGGSLRSRKINRHITQAGVDFVRRPSAF